MLKCGESGRSRSGVTGLLVFAKATDDFDLAATAAFFAGAFLATEGFAVTSAATVFLTIVFFRALAAMVLGAGFLRTFAEAAFFADFRAGALRRGFCVGITH